MKKQRSSISRRQMLVHSAAASLATLAAPMINLGRADVKVLDDGWTAVTRDRSLSAQFEHSVGITADGCEIFTASPAGFDAPPFGG